MAKENIYKVLPKNGKESFFNKGKNQEFNLLDFWSWSQSDLLNNTLRGVLAEYIVMKDLGIEQSARIEWDAFDLEMESGIKVEVKSSAYLQSWSQEGLSKINFDIAPKKGWDARKNEYLPESKRYADIYVFCLLNHKDKTTVNPMNLEQWNFYLLPTTVLDSFNEKQKKITLNSLLKLNPQECAFGEIRSAIENLIGY